MKIFHDAISRKTIFNRCKMIHEEIDSINMTVSPGCPRTIRTKNIIQKINSRLKRMSSRKLAQELDISRTNCSSGMEK